MLIFKLFMMVSVFGTLAFGTDHPIERSQEIQNKALRGYSQRGMKRLQREEFDLALEDFDLVIGLNPASQDAYLHRGQAHYGKKEWTLALADFSQSLKLDPNLADAYYERGNVYSKQKERTRAITDFSQALKINPSHYRARYARGMANFDNADWNRAAEDFTGVLKQNPADVPTYIARGLAYYYANKSDQALSDLSRASKLAPSDPMVYCDLGLVYLQKKNETAAIANFNQALKLNPKLAEAVHGRALAYGAEREFSKALEDFDLALRLNPKDELARKNRDLILKKNPPPASTRPIPRTSFLEAITPQDSNYIGFVSFKAQWTQLKSATKRISTSDLSGNQTWEGSCLNMGGNRLEALMAMFIDGFGGTHLVFQRSSKNAKWDYFQNYTAADAKVLRERVDPMGFPLLPKISGETSLIVKGAASVDYQYVFYRTDQALLFEEYQDGLPSAACIFGHKIPNEPIPPEAIRSEYWCQASRYILTQYRYVWGQFHGDSFPTLRQAISDACSLDRGDQGWGVESRHIHHCVKLSKAPHVTVTTASDTQQLAEEMREISEATLRCE